MKTKEQQLIQDVLRASVRASPLLFDNFGIKINVEKAKKLYCINYNKALVIDITKPPHDWLQPRPKEDHIIVETMTLEQEKLAIIEHAYLISETWK